MIEEDAVHRAAHRLVTAKAERQVRQAAREMDVRTADADDLHRLDEIDRIIVMLLKPRRDREDIGIEDDVLGRDRSEEGRVGKECVSTGRSRGVPYHENKKTTRLKSLSVLR